MINNIFKKFNKVGSDQFFLTVIIPIIIFWLIFYLLGYPNPHADDLFYIGTSLNLAENGKFGDPLLRFLNEKAEHGFFFLPPFYYYTLGAWLSIWGISAKSIFSFHCISYIGSSISVALILKKYGFAKIRITTFLISIVLALTWMGVGSRYDALGKTLLLIGIYLLTKDSQWRYFWGFSFLGYAILTTPVVVTYAVPFAAAMVIHNYLKKKEFNKVYLINRIVALGLAFIFIFSIFLIFINFQFDQFLNEFFGHITRTDSPSVKWSFTKGFLYVWDLLSRNHNFLLVGPLYIQYLILSIVCFFFIKPIKKSLKYFLITINIGMFLNVLIYAESGNYSTWILIAIILIIMNIELPKKSMLFLYIITFCLLCLSQTITIISIIGQESVNKLEYQEIKNKVDKMTNKTIFVDEVSARFVFDYRLPKGAINWGASHPIPKVEPTSIKDKKPDQVWVIASTKGKVVEGLSSDYPKVKIFGHQFNSIPKKPYEVIIVE